MAAEQRRALGATGLLRELEQVAVEEDRSVAAEVRRLIRRHVEGFRERLGGGMARTLDVRGSSNW